MNKVITYCFVALLLAGSLPALAQVEAEERINMTGTSNGDRTAEGLDAPIQSDAAVNATTFQSGGLIYMPATGTDNVQITLAPAPTTYVAGMVLNFKATAPNTGAMTLNVNGLGAISIKQSVDQDMISNQMLIDQLVSVIYDGTNFQVISPLNKPCPSGYVEVTPEYCIQQDEQPLQTFWDAIVDCSDNNAKLCTWGQWYYACWKTGLGLNDMTNNWEWIDSAGNHGTQDGTSARIAGDTDCKDAYNGIPNNGLQNVYRCCYNK
jgi:hypothetical protein